MSLRKQLQGLADYLNGDGKVYDLPAAAVQHFREETGRDPGSEDDHAADMDDEELAAFEAWANENLHLADYWRHDMEDAPPWVHFDRAKVVGPTWAIHFTAADQFPRLSRGVSVSSLGITKSGMVERFDIDCEAPEDFVEAFVFAFAWPMRQGAFGKFEDGTKASLRLMVPNGRIFA
jgi:hypothetical protein